MRVESELRWITWSLDEGVATVVLNRPDRGNAWTGRMEAEYRIVLDAAEQSDRVGAIVITGAGKHFCVGADAAAVSGISERGEYSSGLRAPFVEPGDPEHPAHGARHGFLLSLTKPVIAAINGSAAGIGFAIACFCDVRFIAEKARLTTATAPLGLPAEFGVSWILPRLIGVSRAMPLLLGSPKITGAEAEALGLAHRALPAADVVSAAQQYARQLVTTAAPSSMASAKAQVWLDMQRSLAEADRDADARLKQMVRSADFAVGARALSQRSRPDFAAKYRRPSISGANDA